MKSYKDIAVKYAEDCVADVIVCCKETKESCQRFLDDLKREDLELRTFDPDLCINIIQTMLVHRQGQDIDGNPLMGTPFILQPWQIFIVYNLVGFYKAGTKERRFKEGLIFVPRKNGKTSFIAALSYALSILERRSGSQLYIIAASMKQAQQSFEFLVNSIKTKDDISNYRVLNNNSEHSLFYEFPDGSMRIEALASNPDKHDSFNCNLCIADEIHAFTRPAQYNRFKESQAAYTNRLIIGITTAGDNTNSFGYDRLQYALKVSNRTINDDSLFTFISRAEQADDGSVDYTDPHQHQIANPSYGVTIRPDKMMSDALQAQNDPIQRKDFLSRSLNIYTSAMKAYFNVDEFRRSDSKFDISLEELPKMGLDWYGGADLSKMHDLTAASLYAHSNELNADICITHAFCPISMAAQKSDKDHIPLFGWQEDGWLTICNSPTVNYADVVKWFTDMRKMGFRIRQIGHDRKFGREYIGAMKQAGFAVVDQPQYYYVKSEGFRHIEKSAKDGNFYYLHSQAFEYCVSNVACVEKNDDMVIFYKLQQEHRIDLFDASVFACCRYLESSEKSNKAKKWWD